MQNNNYSEFPEIGIGTYQINDVDIFTNVLSAAIELGCNLVDTSPAYSNEIKLGKAITAVGRERLLIQNKVWNTERGYSNTIAACKKSLSKMKLDYFDSYLIHFPATNTKDNPGYYSWMDINADTYRALQQLKEEGLVRHIGVSNFMPFQLDELHKDLNVYPEINQIEFHPGYIQEESVIYCKMHGIKIQSASPLGNGTTLNDKTILEMSRIKETTPAQICVKYSIAHNIMPLIKTTNPEHLRIDCELNGFELTRADMYYIERMKPNRVNWLLK